jgi:SAM-dependent methyltransferase
MFCCFFLCLLMTDPERSGAAAFPGQPEIATLFLGTKAARRHVCPSFRKDSPHSRHVVLLPSLGNDYLNSLGQPGSAFSARSEHAINPVAYDFALTGSGTTGTQVSTSGVSYQQVTEGLDLLYPHTELASRNAASRTDGYWPFVRQANSEPPLEYTYGEFDAIFFAELLDQAAAYLGESFDGKIVCDVGSGTGRLVVAAAALHPRLTKVRGVEILPGIHQVAVNIVARCSANRQLPPRQLPLAPMELICGSISDATVVDISDVDVFFIASTCMPPAVLLEIANAIGRRCCNGTLVITTDQELVTERTYCEATGKHFEFQKVSQTDGYCWVVGGVSTGFTYRLAETAIP